MKPPLRTKSVGTKVSEAEFALLEERARGAGLRLAEWVREALLSAPVESGPDSGEVALGEVLALRSLLLNLHFRAAKGEPVAEAEMRGLIERADGVALGNIRRACLPLFVVFPPSQPRSVRCCFSNYVANFCANYLAPPPRMCHVRLADDQVLASCFHDIH
jgi:hypothetical protein